MRKPSERPLLPLNPPIRTEASGGMEVLHMSEKECIGGCDWTLTADFTSDRQICRRCGREQPEMEDDETLREDDGTPPDGGSRWR